MNKKIKVISLDKKRKEQEIIKRQKRIKRIIAYANKLDW